MITLCLGGSFNPIHHGHLICARAAAESFGLPSVRLVTTCNPPHKPRQIDLASAQDRLAMCRAAVETDSLFHVDDRECRRGGPSFTLDTARDLRREGYSRICWLIGADMLRTLPQWHEAQALLSEVEFVILARPGWSMDWSTMPPAFRSLETRIVQAPVLEISATEIRRRVGSGLPIDYLTPPAVCKYIREHRLYKTPGSA